MTNPPCQRCGAGGMVASTLIGDPEQRQFFTCPRCRVTTSPVACELKRGRSHLPCPAPGIAVCTVCGRSCCAAHLSPGRRARVRGPICVTCRSAGRKRQPAAEEQQPPAAQAELWEEEAER